MRDEYKGQCFCYPTVEDCEHCNRARAWVDQDVLLRANEIAEDILTNAPEAYDELRNTYDEESDEHKDIYQWFIVSKWLYQQLDAIGEPVAEWKGQYWWGRTCCGQAIELDGTFQQISRGL